MLFIASSSWSQNLNNSFCDAAELMCFRMDSLKTFDFRQNSVCQIATTSLFYEVKTGATISGSLGSFSTSTATTYKLYGPFEDLAEGCNKYNQSAVIPAFTSASAATAHTLPSSLMTSKSYILEVVYTTCFGNIQFLMNREAICKSEQGCQDCIKSFMPTAGKYIVSAWVKKEGATPMDTNYTAARLKVSCPSVAGSTSYFLPSGQVIDGWQRIEGIYTIPPTATNFELKLEVISGSYLFDDVRFFPFDGSMISYVYDPINLRLLAELDERNYAKIYEYDEEGKLIRVKKETEKGIMTIQENRENTKK